MRYYWSSQVTRKKIKIAMTGGQSKFSRHKKRNIGIKMVEKVGEDGQFPKNVRGE